MVLPPARLARDAQCSTLHKCLQVAAGCRLRDAGQLPVDPIGDHSMYLDIAHGLLHPALLEQERHLISTRRSSLSLEAHGLGRLPYEAGVAPAGAFSKRHHELALFAELRGRQAHLRRLIEHDGNMTL